MNMVISSSTMQVYFAERFTRFCAVQSTVCECYLEHSLAFLGVNGSGFAGSHDVGSTT